MALGLVKTHNQAIKPDARTSRGLWQRFVLKKMEQNHGIQ
jgi:hypothetical protein